MGRGIIVTDSAFVGDAAQALCEEGAGPSAWDWSLSPSLPANQCRRSLVHPPPAATAPDEFGPVVGASTIRLFVSEVALGAELTIEVDYPAIKLFDEHGLPAGGGIIQ